MAGIHGSSSETERQQDLYEVLQVSRYATLEVIQAAYRALARSNHPDVNDSPDAARRMRQVNAAYAVLSDAQRRARYDAIRARAARLRTPERREHPSARKPTSATQPAENRKSRPLIRATWQTAVAADPGRLATPRRARTAQIAAIVTALAVLALVLWMLIDSLDDRPRRIFRPHLMWPSSSMYDDSNVFHGQQSQRWITYAID